MAARLYKQVRAQWPPSLPAPTKLLGYYEDFVAQNSSSVSQIETALRSLTYIIPSRFPESQLTTESLHALTNLLALYHDALLPRLYARLPGASAAAAKHTDPHARYTAHWLATAPLYRRPARLLQAVRALELLCEMAARRSGGARGGSEAGRAAQARAVALLEAVKAACRLALLARTGGRPVPEPPLPGRPPDPRAAAERRERAAIEAAAARSDAPWDEPDEPAGKDAAAVPNGAAKPPGSAASTSAAAAAATTDDSPEEDDGAWPMPRTRRRLPPLPRPGDGPAYLARRALGPDAVRAPGALLRRLATARGRLAEIIWILRPLVYALLLLRAQRQRQRRGPGASAGVAAAAPWTPWLVGLALELGARAALRAELRGATGLEREELRRRGAGAWWWLLRGAFYENFTQYWVGAVAGKLKGVPLLDMLGNVLEDYDHLWGEYYFSTASM